MGFRDFCHWSYLESMVSTRVVFFLSFFLSFFLGIGSNIGKDVDVKPVEKERGVFRE